MPTHGSLTKAGKVRNQTPKVASSNKKSVSPRRRNLQKYKLMVSNAQTFGGRGGRGRRGRRGRRR